MKIFGQEKITGGTYTLNKDISTYYVLKGDYKKILKERDFLPYALDDTQKQLAQLKGEIAQTDFRKQTRAQLEQLKRNAEAELAKQRVKLAVALQVASITKENTNSNSNYYNRRSREPEMLLSKTEVVSKGRVCYPYGSSRANTANDVHSFCYELYLNGRDHER